MWILTEKNQLVNTDHILYFDVAPMDDTHILWANLNMTSLAFGTYPTEVKAHRVLEQIINSLLRQNAWTVRAENLVRMAEAEEKDDGT